MFNKGKYHRIYLSVLAFIALLVASSLAVIDIIVTEEAAMADISNIGSRQRMLSERIVHLTLEYSVEQDREARNHHEYHEGDPQEDEHDEVRNR